jgi:hypothetical protein
VITANSSGPHTSDGGELDDRVTPVVGPADETQVEQPVRQEAPDEPLALVVAERLPSLVSSIP